nr:AP2-like ethylene-responsive transcription factor AIL6 isoform X1 [Ipomoea trifida]
MDQDPNGSILLRDTAQGKEKSISFAFTRKDVRNSSKSNQNLKLGSVDKLRVHQERLVVPPGFVLVQLPPPPSPQQQKQLEDFLGGDIAYFNNRQDLQFILGIQAFSTNFGSYVDDSASVPPGLKSSPPPSSPAVPSIQERPTEALSLAVNTQTT